jgi:phage baseplate assembly protein V
MLGHNFAISLLNGKLANSICIGPVKEIDYEKAIVRVKVGEVLTDWLPWVTYRAGEEKRWSPPRNDDQLIVLSPFGGLSLAVVLPEIYQQKCFSQECRKTANISEFGDGTKLSYNGKFIFKCYR